MKQVQFLQPGVESSSNTWELTTQSTPTCVNTAVYVHTVGKPVLSTTIHTYVCTYNSISTMGEHLGSKHILYTGDEHSTVTKLESIDVQ